MWRCAVPVAPTYGWAQRTMALRFLALYQQSTGRRPLLRKVAEPVTVSLSRQRGTKNSRGYVGLSA